MLEIPHQNHEFRKKIQENPNFLGFVCTGCTGAHPTYHQERERRQGVWCPVGCQWRRLMAAGGRAWGKIGIGLGLEREREIEVETES